MALAPATVQRMPARWRVRRPACIRLGRHRTAPSTARGCRGLGDGLPCSRASKPFSAASASGSGGGRRSARALSRRYRKRSHDCNAWQRGCRHRHAGLGHRAEIGHRIDIGHRAGRAPLERAAPGAQRRPPRGGRHRDRTGHGDPRLARRTARSRLRDRRVVEAADRVRRRRCRRAGVVRREHPRSTECGEAPPWQGATRRGPRARIHEEAPRPPALRLRRVADGDRDVRRAHRNVSRLITSYDRSSPSSFRIISSSAHGPAAQRRRLRGPPGPQAA